MTADPEQRTWRCPRCAYTSRQPRAVRHCSHNCPAVDHFVDLVEAETSSEALRERARRALVRRIPSRATVHEYADRLKTLSRKADALEDRLGRAVEVEARCGTTASRDGYPTGHGALGGGGTRGGDGTSLVEARGMALAYPEGRPDATHIGISSSPPTTR